MNKDANSFELLSPIFLLKKITEERDTNLNDPLLDVSPNPNLERGEEIR